MEALARLGIDLPSLLAQIINFIILLTLLYLFGYKRIIAMLDSRSQRIKESQEKAEAIKEQYAQAQEQVKAQLETARREGQALIAQAAQMGERLKEEARQEARQEAQTLVARARQEMDREREEAMDVLRQEFAGLAIRAAERVINQSLDRESHRRLIEEVLAQSDELKRE